MNQRPNFNQKPETLLKVQSCQPGPDVAIHVTLGLCKQPERPSWGKTNETRPYYPSSEVERQVYLQGSKVSLLTDQRLIEVSTLRPIDNLVMIIMQIARSSRLDSEVFKREFEDFAGSHSMSETCAMLVQILADTDGQYLISQRI